LLSQFEAGPVEPGLHLVGVEGQRLRRLFRGQPFKVAEQDDHPQVAGQMFHRFREFLVRFAEQQGGLRETRCVGDVESLLHGVKRHEAGVAGHAKEPGMHAFGVAEVSETAESLRQSVLNDVVSGVRLAADHQSVFDRTEPAGQFDLTGMGGVAHYFRCLW